MKTLKRFYGMPLLALLLAGCAAPVSHDTPYAEWRQQELLPPTGTETPRVYSQRQTYPAIEPSIIVQTDQQRNSSGDLALGDAIRQQFEYDRGLAPSLRHVTVEVRDGRVVLQG